jgi:hypothetical protein
MAAMKPGQSAKGKEVVEHTAKCAINSRKEQDGLSGDANARI